MVIAFPAACSNVARIDGMDRCCGISHDRCQRSNEQLMKNRAKLVAFAASKPGALNYTSGGNASQTHLAAEQIGLRN